LWEKALLRWASAKGKPSILSAGVAEDEHIMYAISVVAHAVSAKPQLLGTMLGCVRLFKELESFENLLTLF